MTTNNKHNGEIGHMTNKAIIPSYDGLPRKTLHGGAYNYIQEKYLLINTKCYLNIDRIIISILNKYSIKNEHNIRNKLFSEFSPDEFTMTDTWISNDKEELNKSMYRRIRKITSINTGKRISILYDRNKSFYPLFRFQIDDPDDGVIDFLSFLQGIHSFDYNLSQVELAFDFVPYKYELHQFLKKHLYLNYSRERSWSYGDDLFKSHYIGHRAFNARSIDMYRKIIENQPSLRMELRLNKQTLKTLNLQLPLDNIDEINFRRIINLKSLNMKKMENYIRRKYKHKTKNWPTWKQKLWMRTIRSLSMFGGPVMDIKMQIKNSRYYHHNYTKLFDNIEDINDVLHEKLSSSIVSMYNHDNDV